MTARSKAWVCGSSIGGIAGSTSGDGCLSVVSVVCCQVEVSETSRSLVQRIPGGYRVSECDRVTSIMRRPRLTRHCRGVKRTILRLFALLATL